MISGGQDRRRLIMNTRKRHKIKQDKSKRIIIYCDEMTEFTTRKQEDYLLEIYGKKERRGLTLQINKI